MMVVTLLTAGLCGLVYLWLSVRVVQTRQKSKVSLGDGGDAVLLQRIRAHANFAEYVPICLILIAAIELSFDIAPQPLWFPAVGLVVVRLCHAIGMSQPGANIWRAVGAVGTWIVMLSLSLWAVWIALT